jgi:hypothetical protein
MNRIETIYVVYSMEGVNLIHHYAQVQAYRPTAEERELPYSLCEATYLPLQLMSESSS